MYRANVSPLEKTAWNPPKIARQGFASRILTGATVDNADPFGFIIGQDFDLLDRDPTVQKGQPFCRNGKPRHCHTLVGNVQSGRVSHAADMPHDSTLRNIDSCVGCAQRAIGYRIKHGFDAEG